MKLHHPRLAALLAASLLTPGLSLLGQDAPPRPPAEQTAKDVIKEAQKPADKKEAAKEPTDPIERIKKEGLERSEVMKTLGHLADVIGPRLTNSPNMKRANEWTRETLAGWGLKDAHLEPWGPFGRGWDLERFGAQVVEPQCIPLIAFPKAWSPSLDGPLTAEVVHLDAKDEKGLEQFKGKLGGKVVLIGAEREVQAHFDAQGRRLTDSQLLALADSDPPGGGLFRRPRPPADANANANRPARPTPPPRPSFEFLRKRYEFLAAEKPALLVEPSTIGDGGTLFVYAASISAPAGFGAGAPRRASVWAKDAPKAIPQLVLAVEHYNRLIRIIAAGQTPMMAVELKAKFNDDDLMGYNTVAEIPGTDLKDEVVMLGGHMDSWHGGTGATDNAAGCAVGMEAVRIIQKLGLKPRRTVRIALWSGEEQGLLGSRAYVKEHFGGYDDPATTPAGLIASVWGGKLPERKFTAKAEYEKLSAYFNLDNGTGKIRGVYMEGNEAVRPIFRKWLAPFRELGASTLSAAPTGGTDHQSFDGIGLPGFQFIQDPVEYDSRTHHSNMDVFDRIQADDMKQASVVMAAFILNAANADEKLPRKPFPAARPRTASPGNSPIAGAEGHGGRPPADVEKAEAR